MTNVTLEIPGGGQFYLDGDGLRGAVLTIPKDTEIQVFRDKVLMYPRFAENALGLYTMVPMEGLREVDITIFDDPEYGLAPRQAGCVWDPALMIGASSEKMRTYGVQHQSELCTDFLWKKCWRQLLGPGGGIRDIESTPGSRQLLFEAIAKLHAGMSNDIWLLGHYGSHPDFEKADANGWWRANKSLNPTKWARLLKQQRTLGGLYTMVDSLKNVTQLEHFNIELDPTLVSGKKFTGDALKYVDDVKEQLPEKLGNADQARINICTVGLFNRMKELIKLRYSALPEAYNIEVMGHDNRPKTLRLDPRRVIQYDGDWYIRDDTQAKKDSLCGTITHRLLVCAPGVFGVGYDVDISNQDNGMGMTVSHWKTPPFMGKTYFSADFELGFTVLGQNDWIANSSLVLEPA